MRIQNTLSGDFYFWPGFCKPDNRWTVPAKFEVKQILGELVFKVLDIEAKAMLVAEMTQYRISGVVGNAEGGVAPPWQYLGECEPEGEDAIKVFFGNAVIALTIAETETHECTDLERVDTPPTPVPFSFSPPEAWRHRLKLDIEDTIVEPETHDECRDLQSVGTPPSLRSK